MAQALNLSQAMEALKDFYGDSFADGYEDGKDDMAQTLQDTLQLSAPDAKEVVNALVQARMVRYEGSVSSAPAPEGTAGSGPIIEGTWTL